MITKLNCVADVAGLYVYYSANESAVSGGKGFWSRDREAFVDVEDATLFTKDDKNVSRPMSLGDDVALMSAEDALPTRVFVEIAKRRAGKV